MAERPKPRVPAPDEYEQEVAELFESWADLFAPMIAPDRYRLLLQLGQLGLVSDEQAQRLAALWGRR